MIHLTITVQDFQGKPRLLFRLQQATVTSDRSQALARTIRVLLVPFLRYVAQDHHITFREAR